ncbi:LOW QUALITY PROTEIN: olfactory receptor 477-like [Tachyglossus aculeatus]|uniref:LOW QUALITY PROTEIN: olfactory receptor 477-like n=1 Tax=Tachyglossus aculeatus TaxID=9261 RepID=UPI0018F72636|nr:LOW QUALITY PROTEIN: olfactory receptor 477-like [Tachyglossus aculeatus]
MAGQNHSTIMEFILLGLTSEATFRAVLFVTFLGICMMTLLGNLSIIMLIRVSSKPYTPMYFFLSHVAAVDIRYSSCVTPATLGGFLADLYTMPLADCVVQVFYILTFGTAECFLLAAFAYDRYIAVCSPRLYSVKMSDKFFILLVVSSYIGGFVNTWTFTSCLLNIHFCGPKQINHFFCDLSPLLKLYCSDISVIKINPSVSSGSIIVFTMFVIVISYVYILLEIRRMNSKEGREHKAFSTCTSHFTAVTLYHGTITFIHVMPKSSYSIEQDKVVSVLYPTVIPMLNPLIDSLRNKDVQEVLKKVIDKKKISLTIMMH